MEVGAIMSSSFLRLKLVIYIHLILIVAALQGSWLPPAYLFYNILFFITLFWSLHCKESIDAIHTAALINAASILFDIGCIIGFFPNHNAWSVAFTIINLIVRPFTLILIHRELIDRGGTLTAGVVILPSTQQRTYEDIDRPTQSVPTNNQQSNVASIF